MNDRIDLFNPSSKDFTVKYDIKGNGTPSSYTIKSMEIASFEKPVARHMLKHLANYILHTRGVEKNPELDLQNIKKEILVNQEDIL